jgi:light-regulated signal transduction histidine kinase (bacteriophytochrome)
MENLTNYINHSRNFGYMSGIERDRLRQKETAEVFTPTDYVQQILDEEEQNSANMFKDWTNTYMDNSCGDGQFLSEVVIRKMERSGCTLEQALSTTYGVELMEDNVKLCKERLAGPNPTQEILDILDRNIVCADALKYHYRFDGTPPYTTEQELKLNEFFQ